MQKPHIFKGTIDDLTLVIDDACRSGCLPEGYYLFPRSEIIGDGLRLFIKNWYLTEEEKREIRDSSGKYENINPLTGSLNVGTIAVRTYDEDHVSLVGAGISSFEIFYDCLLKYLSDESPADRASAFYIKALERTLLGTGKLGTKKRKRPVSPDVLHNCLEAMKIWLNENKSLQVACDFAGVDKKTVRRRIPHVLEMVDENERISWIARLRALGEEKHLGRFREV